MQISYSLEGSAVLADGRAALTLEEVRRFMSSALRRKLRLRGALEWILGTLSRDGKTTYAWDYVRRATSNKYRVSVTILASEGGYRLSCTGRQAEYTVERVQRRLDQLLREEEGRNKPRAKRTSQRKRRTNRRAPQQRTSELKVSRPSRDKRRFVAAPLSLEKKERVSLDAHIRPQFRKQHVSWYEAIKATVAIFDIKTDGRHTAKEVITAELHHSLEKSGGAFAKFSRSGFTLRFDLVDGIWRGDITPLTISATKRIPKLEKQARKLYQRMRDYFRTMLGFLTDSERRERRLAHEAALALRENTVVMMVSSLPYQVA